MENRNVRKMETDGRTALRRRLGKTYQTGRRYLLWYSGTYRFAKRRMPDRELPYVHASHATPLTRRLMAVDEHYQHNKINNLHLAVEKLDGLILQPGETMSYWKLIGRPTYEKGYLDGVVLDHGRIGFDVGGGLCQLSNLIFWMTLHTPLTVSERHRHSYDMFPDRDRSQPFGSGATCVFPERDLMITNDTGYPFQLRLRVGEDMLEGEWRCAYQPYVRFEVVEREHEYRPEYFGGYSRHNKLYRQVLNPDGELLWEELMVENHALMMYTPLLEQKIS